VVALFDAAVKMSAYGYLTWTLLESTGQVPVVRRGTAAGGLYWELADDPEGRTDGQDGQGRWARFWRGVARQMVAGDDAARFFEPGQYPTWFY
jgi:hypothetical protein